MTPAVRSVSGTWHIHLPTERTDNRAETGCSRLVKVWKTREVEDTQTFGALYRAFGGQAVCGDCNWFQAPEHTA